MWSWIEAKVKKNRKLHWKLVWFAFFEQQDTFTDILMLDYIVYPGSELSILELTIQHDIAYHSSELVIHHDIASVFRLAFPEHCSLYQNACQTGYLCAWTTQRWKILGWSCQGLVIYMVAIWPHFLQPIVYKTTIHLHIQYLPFIYMWVLLSKL